MSQQIALTRLTYSDKSIHFTLCAPFCIFATFLFAPFFVVLVPITHSFALQVCFAIAPLRNHRSYTPDHHYMPQDNINEISYAYHESGD